MTIKKHGELLFLDDDPREWPGYDKDGNWREDRWPDRLWIATCGLLMFGAAIAIWFITVHAATFDRWLERIIP